MAVLTKCQKGLRNTSKGCGRRTLKALAKLNPVLGGALTTEAMDSEEGATESCTTESTL